VPQGKLRVLVTRDPRFLDAAGRVLRVAHGGIAEDPQPTVLSRPPSVCRSGSFMSNHAGVDVHPPPLILADVLPVYSPTTSRLGVGSSTLASSTVQRDDESVGRASLSDGDDDIELRLAGGSHTGSGLTAPLLGPSSARGSGAERTKSVTQSGVEVEAQSLASEHDAVANGRFQCQAAFRMEGKQEGHVRFDVYR
jgi:hypothetical protein